MSKRRLVITAVLAGSSQSEVARSYGVSQGWISRLMARYRAEGESAFEPRSRRPHSSPNATAADTVELIVTLRADLIRQGLDAGADTISWHLAHHHGRHVARATVHRVLVRHGLITPEPRKRPRTASIRFQADLPNECWQADFTHYRLIDGTDTEILTWLDDCTRYALSLTAHHRVSGSIVLDTFRSACDQHGRPASTLTDNGMVFTTRLSGHPGRNAFETELARLGIVQKNGRGGHPQTQGKVERFQQTMLAWLSAQPEQPATLTDLQTLLDRFTRTYNHDRGHRSLPHRAVPATIYTTLPKATPTSTTPSHERVRTDIIDTGGTVTLRVAGRLHHIGIGRTHARTHVLILVQDLHITVLEATTGQILRDLILDPTRDYQPQPPK
jgi:transposase InsO family protein